MNMKLIVSGAAMLIASSAGAVEVNFGEYAAANGEQIVEGQTIGFNGVGVTFSSDGGFALLDDPFQGRIGGLGACTTGTIPCGDLDNVQAGQNVTLTFGMVSDVSNLAFRGREHFPVDAPPEEIMSDETLLIGTDGGLLTEFTFGAAQSAFFPLIQSITFAYGGSNPEQFYLTSADVQPIPLPATLPMLAAGLGLIAFVRRRRPA